MSEEKSKNTIAPVKGPTISLVMIVKNEEKVLERCLESVKAIVDEYVICDTGSTDGTIDIIRKYTDTVHTLPYTFEVETRQKSLALATGDYVLMMDADEWIPNHAMKLRQYAACGVNCVSTLILDVTGPEQAIVNQYVRNRIFKNNTEWYYTGPNTHGYLTGPSPALHDQRIHVFHSHDHKHTSAEAAAAKVDRTLAPLEKAIQEDPTDTRAHFYLARTYMSNSVNRLEDAIKTFEHYLAMPNSDFKEERWWAQFDIARCKYRLKDTDGCLADCDKAIRMDPDRAEPYVVKGLVYYDRSEWYQASVFFGLAMTKDVPQNAILFLDPRQYWEIPADYLATCFNKMGQVAKALELTKQLIARKPAVDQRLINNVAEYEKWLAARKGK